MVLSSALFLSQMNLKKKKETVQEHTWKESMLQHRKSELAFPLPPSHIHQEHQCRERRPGGTNVQDHEMLVHCC